MAIFSKKNNAKGSGDQAKVILDESLEGKKVEDSPVNESTSPAEEPARESTAQESIAQVPTNGSSGGAVPAEPATVVAAETAAADSDHEDIEPESLTPPVAPLEHRFGIDDAILLMRSLPADPNAALVVRVVRVTLGAVNVSVEEIVEDALRKEARIKETIGTLEARIVDLEGQLGNLRREIATHQADLKETIGVRERLHMADQYTGHKPPPPPIAATLARLSSSKPISS